MTPIPDPSLPIENQDPLTLLAMAIWAESRNQKTFAKIGMASVVRNRVSQGKYGQGLSGVILKPYQFSSFNHNDPNRIKMLTPVQHDGQHVWDECYWVAQGVSSGYLDDPTTGAVFYFSLPLTAPPHAWGDVVQTCVIDGLSFYKEAPTASLVPK